MKLEDLMTEYGNIQKKDIVGKPEFAHVGGERLQPLCLRAGIEFAPCVDGFKQRKAKYTLIKDGVVIYTVDLEKMKAEIGNHEKRNTPEVQEKRRIATENKYRKDEEFDIAKRACEVGSGRVGVSFIHE